MEDLPLKQIIEGAILAAEAPLSVDQLMQLFEEEVLERNDVKNALKEIEQDCDGRGYELKQVASGYRFQVRTEYGEWVSRLWKEKPPRYSRALLETLALVAYKQPITRGDIEEIRGVAVSTNIMRTLIEREWVRIVGHRDVPGQPALYATTKNFLDYFNLSNLDELPTLAEIRDLTKVNEELDMEEELIEVRTLEIDAEEQEAVAGLDDTDLDAVSEQVDNIQQNIKNLFEEDAEKDKELEAALSEETALSEEEQEPSASDEEPSANEEPSASNEEPSAISEEPSANEEPSATALSEEEQEPSADKEPSATALSEEEQEPSANKELEADKEQNPTKPYSA